MLISVLETLFSDNYYLSTIRVKLDNTVFLAKRVAFLMSPVEGAVFLLFNNKLVLDWIGKDIEIIPEKVHYCCKTGNTFTGGKFSVLKGAEVSYKKGYYCLLLSCNKKD